MNKIGTLFAVGSVIMGAVNISLFFVWWNLIEVTAEAPVSERGYTLETLALNITFLEVVLVLLGVVLAVLSLFGYTEIKRAAVAAAEREARGETSKQLAKFAQQQFYESRRGEQSESPGIYPPGEPTTGSVERAQGE